jgi:hypothetical protein
MVGFLSPERLKCNFSSYKAQRMYKHYLGLNCEKKKHFLETLTFVHPSHNFNMLRKILYRQWEHYISEPPL